MNSRKRESRKRDLIYLAPELRQLVRQTMEVLGQQYVLHFGRPIHKELMQVRSQMADLRHSPHHVQVQVLKRLRARFRKMTPEQRKVLAHGFSLMMEITNVCENAYRAHRLGQRSTKRPMGSGLITWVITAHPTESRSKILLPLLRRLQGELMSSLTQGWVSREESIRSLISVITRSPLAPQQRPRPEEEADYLFASCLHPDNVEALTERDDLSRLFRLKTWVGGDKDGHPGVDEKTLLYSLHRSRRHLLTVIENWLVDWRDTASVHPDYNSAGVDALLRSLHTLERLDPGDFDRVRAFQGRVRTYLSRLPDQVAPRPVSRRLENLFASFPALVIPVELRESSDVMAELVAAPPQRRPDFALYRMLRTLTHMTTAHSIADYVDCLVISMTHTHEDLERARALIHDVHADMALEVVPLFETLNALEASADIVEKLLRRNRDYLKFLKARREGRMQIMLGYSDSAKESGVAPSRMHIVAAFKRIEESLRRFRLKPLFFHGMGGSVDRGGGSLDEQTSSWSAEMLKHFKATYQGEVVSRTFSHPSILISQIERVMQAQRERAPSLRPEDWGPFVDHVREAYTSLVRDPSFLDMVKTATLYPYLHELRLGSRPAKRKTLTGVSDLRAIPWVLCWTQSRLLLPTWWGVGQAWSHLSRKERKRLQALYRHGQGAWTAFIKQLRFTLAKVEPAVFEFMLTTLAPEHKWRAGEFCAEFDRACRFVRELTGEKEMMAHKPWLGESIYLRSPLIHPLNVLQTISVENQELDLLRITTTGIASGMLTTG